MTSVAIRPNNCFRLHVGDIGFLKEEVSKFVLWAKKSMTKCLLHHVCAEQEMNLLFAIFAALL
jgi:hypothetical protein